MDIVYGLLSFILFLSSMFLAGNAAQEALKWKEKRR